MKLATLMIYFMVLNLISLSKHYIKGKSCHDCSICEEVGMAGQSACLYEIAYLPFLLSAPGDSVSSFVSSYL